VYSFEAFRRERPKGVSLSSAHAGSSLPHESAVQVYDKARLLQFGEYVPLGHLLPLSSVLSKHVEGGSFPVVSQERFPNALGEMGTLICFESTFSGLARQAVINGAQMLFVLTNDAWFLKSAAARQHALQSQFRAIETGRAVVRVANTGLSRVYLPNGQVEGTLSVWQEGGETFEVPFTATSRSNTGWEISSVALPLLLGLVAASPPSFVFRSLRGIRNLRRPVGILARKTLPSGVKDIPACAVPAHPCGLGGAPDSL